MSPGRKLALDVTWSWPVVVVMLTFGLLPLYGPLLGPIEGLVAPVTSKVSFVDVRPAEGGMHVRMAYTKLRNCEIIGVSLDSKGVPLQFEPLVGSADRLNTRGTGSQISRQWFVGATDTEGLRLRFLHRCNPFYITVTVAFP